MNMRDLDLYKFLDGKMGTGRPLDFKILVGKWHKVISDRKIGAWGEIFITNAEIMRIGDLSDEQIRMLGYSSIEEYLSEPFNKGMTKDSLKKFIWWSEFRPNWDKIKQILAK